MDGRKRRRAEERRRFLHLAIRCKAAVTASPLIAAEGHSVLHRLDRKERRGEKTIRVEASRRLERIHEHVRAQGEKACPPKPPVALNSPYALVLLDIVALSLSRQVIVVLPDQHDAEDGNATNKTEGYCKVLFFAP